MNINDYLVVNDEVKRALDKNQPVVALESSIISHGMPYPTNVETALMAEKVVREYNAIPATIGVHNGKIVVGLSEEEIRDLSNNPDRPEVKAIKASVKGIPYAIINGLNAGFTIAAIIRIAHMVGIKFMATGGIGGVSKGGELSLDVSADLEEMARSSVAIIGAGCKSILDIGRTKEYLETKDVPVIGIGVDSFPAFFTRTSKYPIDYRIDDMEKLARFLHAKWGMGFQGSVMLSNPVPKEFEMEEKYIEGIIADSIRLAEENGISGERNTPFLLSKVCELTKGESLRTNVEIIRNNAKVAAQIANIYSRL